MHPEAYTWIAKYATDDQVRVLDIGGRYVTHDPRELFPNATDYTVLDSIHDEGVDIVANAATWSPQGQWDIVIAAEVFEHTEEWREICGTAWKALRPGGQFIVTTAAPSRPPHSATDGQAIRKGEWYGNIDPEELRSVLEHAKFIGILIDEHPTTADVRAVAMKGGRS